jgi:hemin uptake protein HemP
MQPTHIEDASTRVPTTPPPRTLSERVVSTKELLGGAHRIWIEHAAQRYLLQVTRSGKLILTK